MIPWYVYAIAATFFATAFSIIRKKALLKAHAMSFESARTMVVALLSLFLIPFIDLNVDWKIILVVYAASVVGTIGILFAAKGLRHEAISLIAPLGNIEPGFVALLAFFFLGESLGARKIIGLGVILVAAYLLESDHHFSDFYAPIKNLLRDKYSLYFLFAVALFSCINVVNKYVIDNHLNIFTLFLLTWVFIAINFNIALRSPVILSEVNTLSNLSFLLSLLRSTFNSSSSIGS